MKILIYRRWRGSRSPLQEVSFLVRCWWLGQRVDFVGWRARRWRVELIR